MDGLLLPSPIQLERLQCYDECDTHSEPMSLYFRVRGPLDPERLRQVLHVIVGRHDGLRMCFSTKVPGRELSGGPDDLELVSVSLAEPGPDALAFSVVPLVGAERELDAVNARLTEFSELPFTLERGPRVRALVLRFDELDWIFALAVDHIVFDPDSQVLLLEELEARYNAPGPVPDLAEVEPGPSYGAFAAEQWSMLASDEGRLRLRHWAEVYYAADGVYPSADLPGLGGRDVGAAGWATATRGALPAAALDRVRQLASDNATTWFNVLLAAFLLSLRRYSGRDHLGVLVSLANRNHETSDDLVGLVAECVPVWVNLAGVTGFEDAVGRVTAASIAGIENTLPMLTSGHFYASGEFGPYRPGAVDPNQRTGGPAIDMFLASPDQAPVLHLEGLEVTAHDVPVREWMPRGGLLYYGELIGDGSELMLVYPKGTYGGDIMARLLGDVVAGLGGEVP